MTGEIIGKYVLSYKITTCEPLAIGGSKENIQVSDLDRKIVKDFDGNPLIPGSSLKGVFRSFFDRIISHIQNLDAKFKFNHIFPENSKTDEKVCDLSGLENIKDFLSPEGICDLCLFFGAKGYGSPLLFLDAFLDSSQNLEQMEKRTHVRIDRGSDTAVKGGLFFVEGVPKNVSFLGRIIFEERDLGDKERENRLKLLFKILVNQFKNREIHLGGMRSRGYGLCLLKIESLHHYSLKDLMLGDLSNVQQIEIDKII